MFASSCNLSWSNEIGYAKINTEINSGTVVYSFFSFSDSIITTWARHHLFLEWLWEVKDSSKFKLDKNQEISVQITLQQKSFCLTSSFAVTLLLSFACEYCHPPDNSLPTDIILTKLSFWRSEYIEYWDMKGKPEKWDPGPYSGTQDPGPSSGTLWWHPMIGPYGGTLRWDPKVGP